MATRVRFLANIIGPSGQYLPDTVATLDDTAAQMLMVKGEAIPEGPSPSGAFVTLYTGAGYTQLQVAPSGNQVLPSGSPGAFFMRDDYHVTMLLPKRQGEFIDGDFYPSPVVSQQIVDLVLISLW